MNLRTLQRMDAQLFPWGLPGTVPSTPGAYFCRSTKPKGKRHPIDVCLLTPEWELDILAVTDGGFRLEQIPYKHLHDFVNLFGIQFRQRWLPLEPTS